MRVGRSPHAQGLDAQDAIIGSSPAFKRVLAVAEAVASNDCVVLLEGESGTGKELVARLIHNRSKRAHGPFIPVNCAGISETLFESQLFGHIRGAFTGAISETLGVVRAAEGGSLLLDEVSEIPFHLQSKLLRLLQEREVVPVGGSRPVPVNVRFLAATNRLLHRMVEAAEFRADLFHRLNIVRIVLPPLRERPDDIERLLDWYLDLHAEEYRMPRRQLGASIRRLLQDYSWPGNVRELCSYVERLYAADLPPMPPDQCGWGPDYQSVASRPAGDPAPGRITEIHDEPITYTLAEAERSAILRALNYADWNRSAAAKLLAVHRSTLLRKMRNYGIEGG